MKVLLSWLREFAPIEGDPVALGETMSDLGMAVEEMHTAIRDAAGLPKLLEALRGRGYDDEALRRIGHANWLRVLERTWGG